MKRVLFMMTAVSLAVAMSATTVTYTADDETIFPNPERGFITMIGGSLKKSAPYGVYKQEGALDAHSSGDKGTLVLVHYYLDNFRTSTTISDEVLNAFDKDMQVLRDKGMKAIIRFSYVNGTYYKSSGEESAEDAEWTYVQKHIAQYKSHWQANADVIFCFQAGIVGAWGEWYYSDNYGNKQSTMNDSRRQVVDALLDAVPADRMIQLRTPLFKTGYMGDTKALTAEEAFSGTPRARLGQHNDAFLYDYDNMGTYTDTAKQKPWLAQETLYVPIGGETDITDLSKAKKWATYEKTTAEMSRLHWTFIQSGYAYETTNWWREPGNGTFDELNRKLGYRYQLVSGTYGSEVKQGEKLSVNIKLKNVGYAPLYNARPAYIVLKNGNKTYSLKLASDPRRWLPNGVETVINEQLTVPASVPAGTYQLYLHLPDAYASLAADPRYAVRFANTGVWEESTGMNKLNATVVVSASGDPQPPEPVVDAVLLPATLDKSNVSEYSDDMSWYNGSYFDFGPEDAANLDRWAEWKVELRYPGEYIVSEVMASAHADWGIIGHSWQLQLLNAESTAVSSYTTEPIWAEGNLSYEDKWDLSAVPTGVYTLNIKNVTEWGQPKLKSITLQYDGVLPAGADNIHVENGVEQVYDLLGRPVDASYKGIVIINGRKAMQLGIY